MKNNTKYSAGSETTLVAGRYKLLSKIGAGGMGSVYLGKQVGAAGFERVVAIKRVSAALVADASALAMFRQEVRLAAHIQHPNVPSAIDVVEERAELWLIMEYVHGPALPLLVQSSVAGAGLPPPIACAIAIGVLNGLHAAHEATDSDGTPLKIVHRDVTPQNVLVGGDGLPRIIDFGVARAANQLRQTQMGEIRGQLAYLAPERLTGVSVDRRSDVYAAAIVLWEMLTGRKLFESHVQAEIIERALSAVVPRPSTLVATLSPLLESTLMRGLEKDPAKRFQTAREMALALNKDIRVASANELADWVRNSAAPFFAERDHQLLASHTVTPGPSALAAQSSEKPNSLELATSGVRAAKKFQRENLTVIAPLRHRVPISDFTQKNGPLQPVPPTQARPQPVGKRPFRLMGEPLPVLARRTALVIAASVLIGMLAASQWSKAASGAGGLHSASSESEAVDRAARNSPAAAADLALGSPVATPSASGRGQENTQVHTGTIPSAAASSSRVIERPARRPQENPASLSAAGAAPFARAARAGAPTVDKGHPDGF